MLPPERVAEVVGEAARVASERGWNRGVLVGVTTGAVAAGLLLHLATRPAPQPPELTPSRPLTQEERFRALMAGSRTL